MNFLNANINVFKEIIIVNDCSSDNTEEAIQDYIKNNDQLKALLNSKEARVIQAGANQIVLELAELPSKKDNQLIVQLDEHTVFNLNVTAKPR